MRWTFTRLRSLTICMMLHSEMRRRITVPAAGREPVRVEGGTLPCQEKPHQALCPATLTHPGE